MHTARQVLARSAISTAALLLRPLQAYGVDNSQAYQEMTEQLGQWPSTASTQAPHRDATEPTNEEIFDRMHLLRKYGSARIRPFPCLPPGCSHFACSAADLRAIGSSCP